MQNYSRFVIVKGSFSDFKESMIIAEHWKIRVLRKNKRYRHLKEKAEPFL